MSFIYILHMFSDLGIRSLILTHDRELDTGFLRSCWTVQILRGFLVGILVAGAGLAIGGLQGAGLFANDSSYASPILPYAIAAMAGGAVLDSLQSPAKFLYEKRMEFRLLTQSRILMHVVSTIMIIILALFFKSVWALVIGTLFNSAANLVVSFCVFRGPSMKLEWSPRDMSAILGRGKWIASHSAQTALINMADRILLGLVMPASMFGFYFIARQIIDLVAGFLEKTDAQMGLQIFRDLQKRFDRKSLSERYYRYRVVFDAIAMTTCGVLLTLSPLLVEILYADAYQRVAGIVQILALGLPLTGPGLIRTAFSAQRRFRAMAVLSFVRMFTIWAGLGVAILVFQSVPGAVLAVALHRVPEIGLLLWRGWREGLVSPIREVRLLPLLAVGAALGWGLEQLWTLIVA